MKITQTDGLLILTKLEDLSNILSLLVTMTDENSRHSIPIHEIHSTLRITHSHANELLSWYMNVLEAQESLEKTNTDLNIER